MLSWLKNSNLVGWVSYSWAAEPFVVSAVGTYVPILLEQVARDNAVWIDDHSIACQDIQYKPDPMDPPGPSGPGGPGGELPRCVVPFLGKYVDTSSLALYTFSLSVLLQTLLVITVSGIADRGNHRKQLLVGFAILGSLTTCMFMFVGKHYYLASLLAVLSNASFGAVTVCGNAFLPVLVREMAAKTVSYTRVSESGTAVGADSLANSASLGGSTSNTPEIYHDISHDIPHDRDPDPSSFIQDSSDIRALNYEAAKVSGLGVAVGYFAAFLVQVVTMLVIMSTGSTEGSLRLAISLVGIWWLVFQIPVIRNLHLDYSDHSSNSPTNTKSSMSIRQLLGTGWTTLFVTIKEARQLKDVALFLLGWFIVSDAATTINSAAVLFARVELQMSAPSLAVIGLLTVLSGISGATIVPRIQPRLGKNPVNAIMFVIALGTLIPLYGILGFYFSHVGLNSPLEMYLLAVVYGFVLGGLNSTARSVFGTMIPDGKETMFFALFSVTDKGSSIIGPAITGLITDHTHNIRYTFYFLLLVMILPIPIFSLIDVDRGQREAEYLAEI